MAVDLSITSIPTPRQGKGEPPTDQPGLLQLLFDRWYEQQMAERDERPSLPAVEGRRFRAHWAGKCARATQYKLMGVEGQKPDLASLWSFFLGDTVHKVVQDLAVEVFEANGEVEVVVDFLDTIELDGSAHADLLLTIELPKEMLSGDGVGEAPDLVELQKAKVLVELKSVNGFKFKKRSGWNGSAEGPGWPAKIQGAMSAAALDCDFLVIADVSLENLSIGVAKQKGIPRESVRRMGAEWWYPRDEFMPWVESERKRLTSIMAGTDDGKQALRIIPDPELPKGHRIINPATGLWQVRQEIDGVDTVVASDTTWHCGYCEFRDRCQEDGP